VSEKKRLSIVFSKRRSQSKEYDDPSVSEASRRRQTTMRREWAATPLQISPSPPKNKGYPNGYPLFFDVEGFELERRVPARVSEKKRLSIVFSKRRSQSEEYDEPSVSEASRRRQTTMRREWAAEPLQISPSPPKIRDIQEGYPLFFVSKEEI